jgi:MFS family permease
MINRNFACLWIGQTISSAFFVPRLQEARVFWLALLSWGCCMLIFACTTNFLVGLVLFLVQGFCNAGINVVVGPLMLRVTPREFVGRAGAVMTPLIVTAQLLSVTCAGALASTLLAGVHFSWLTIMFSPLTIIFLGVGCMSLIAGIYAQLALRRIAIP